MAAELQPPEGVIPAGPPPTNTIFATYSNPPPIEFPTTAISNPPKRQRRPSVRLGEIGGDPPYDSQPRRVNKTWRFQKDPLQASKTRPITDLVNGGGGGVSYSNFQDPVELSDNYLDFSQRKTKSRKPIKRTRTNWNKFESTTNGGGGGGVGATMESGNAYHNEETENNDDEFREFEAEGSMSPQLKDQQSPVNSVENSMGLQFWDQQRRMNNRASENNNEVNSHEEDKQSEGSVGVREWLLGLGLVRYAPVFEIHEVDDEVLPMLTLDDLKDMGISAVGSRRKIYSAILKLQKGLS